MSKSNKMKIYPEGIEPKKTKPSKTPEEIKADREATEIESIRNHPDRPVTQSAYARYSGIDRSRVSVLVKEGTIALTEDGKVIPRHADQARANKSSQSTVVPEEGSAAGTLIDFKTAKAEQDFRLAKVKADEAEGKVALRHDVDNYYYTAVSEARKAFQNLHKRVIPRMSIYEDKQHEATEILRNAVNDILLTLAKNLEVDDE